MFYLHCGSDTLLFYSHCGSDTLLALEPLLGQQELALPPRQQEAACPALEALRVVSLLLKQDALWKD